MNIIWTAQPNSHELYFVQDGYAIKRITLFHDGKVKIMKTTVAITEDHMRKHVNIAGPHLKKTFITKLFSS